MSHPRSVVVGLAALAVVLTALLFVACSSDPNQTTFGETGQDAGVSRRDDSPAVVINFPNGYSNVAFKCNGTTGVYSTKNDNGRAVAAVANDGACVGG